VITDYVLEPEWAVWLVVLEMFIAGLAAGTYLVIAFLNFSAGRGSAGDEDRELAARLGLLPAPLMAITALLLILDLGQQLRFGNLILRSPFAPERGPLPFMFNPNSPMSWASWLLPLFGLATAIVFVDGLLHSGVIRTQRGERRGGLAAFEPLAHNPVILAIGSVLAVSIAAYSGVMISVTNQPIWSDTILLGGLFVAFSALSGMAAAAIVADRLRAAGTAGAVRTGLVSYAAITGVLLAVFVIWIAVSGNAAHLIAGVETGPVFVLTGPVFWIGVVGLAILYPIVVLGGGLRLAGRTRTTGTGTAGRAVLGNLALDRLAVVGAGVLLGALAFRYAILYSALAALH
jgi:hypothetical protein